LRYHIDKLKCKDYQKHKLEGCGYGPLPKQEVQIAPWEEVTIDLMGGGNVGKPESKRSIIHLKAF
jgi:hypothetical protein